MTCLVCRDCNSTTAFGVYPRGCPACARAGRLGLLEVSYDYGGAARDTLRHALTSLRGRTMWRFAGLLPAPAAAGEIVTLGEGGTPLVEARWLEAFTSTNAILLKNETANPTWCSKDRGNSVSVSVGRALGAHGMVALTTGNHGASLAAYCGAASMPAIALMSVHSDVIHRCMVAAYGGYALVSAQREALLGQLVHEGGWFPVTSLDEPVAANPYGVEGYKTIAYEIVQDLGDVPDVVVVPVASGDLLYGIWKGFRELQTLDLAPTCPRMYACQADGAAALATAVRDHLDAVPVLPAPASVAVSIADPTSGRPSLDAIRESGGEAIAVSDEEILEAQRHLASHGMLVEATSAVTVAGVARGVRTGVLRREDRTVCVLTGAGVKWSTQLMAQASPRVVLEPSARSINELARRAQRGPVDRPPGT